MDINLEQNSSYSALIELSGLKTLASNNDVADKLKEVGFTFVTVSGSGSNRQAKGKWSKATQTVQLPDVIKKATKI